MPTPASAVLADIRRRRKIRQAELAERLGIGASYLSQLETGARRMPERFIERMAVELSLSEGERKALEKAARISLRHRTVPTNASPEEYELVDALWGALGRLGSNQINAMRFVILTNVSDSKEGSMDS